MDNCCENMYFYLNFFEALKMLDVNVSIKMKIGEKDFYIIYQIRAFVKMWRRSSSRFYIKFAGI